MSLSTGRVYSCTSKPSKKLPAGRYRSSTCNDKTSELFRQSGVLPKRYRAQGVIEGRCSMLYWAVIFFIGALVAGVLGFGGIAGTMAGIAEILFIIFLILFIGSLFFGFRGRKPR
ncbi:MAG TPA: hypothetical protein DCZ06_01215, partial [Alphaproteobacteria bacterium]|nr:hypothetical protein [Alphaproteobacteria bacterium]